MKKHMCLMAFLALTTLSAFAAEPCSLSLDKGQNYKDPTGILSFEEMKAETQRLTTLKGYVLVESEANIKMHIDFVTFSTKTSTQFRQADVYVLTNNGRIALDAYSRGSLTNKGVKYMTFSAIKKLVERLPDCH